MALPMQPSVENGADEEEEGERAQVLAGSRKRATAIFIDSQGSAG